MSDAINRRTQQDEKEVDRTLLACMGTGTDNPPSATLFKHLLRSILVAQHDAEQIDVDYAIEILHRS